MQIIPPCPALTVGFVIPAHVTVAGGTSIGCVDMARLSCQNGVEVSYRLLVPPQLLQRYAPLVGSVHRA